MDVDQQIVESITRTIRERLALDGDSTVSVDSISVDEQNSEIRIHLLIRTEAEPRVIAAGYFGLTGKVRAALGEKWSDFFPVISPTINRLHA